MRSLITVVALLAFTGAGADATEPDELTADQQLDIAKTGLLFGFLNSCLETFDTQLRPTIAQYREIADDDPQTICACITSEVLTPIFDSPEDLAIIADVENPGRQALLQEVGGAIPDAQVACIRQQYIDD